MIQFTISDPDSVEYVADWIELFITLNNESISKSTLTSYLAQEKGEDPEFVFVDDVWLELDYRQQLYGLSPPFEISSHSISPRISSVENPEYVMCLILSILGNSENTTKTGKLFERLSGEAIKNYTNGKIIIFGYPSKQKVEDIAQNTNERFNFCPHSHFKDRGLDIIAWKPFGDTRCGQIIILFQCASGNTWRSKLLGIPIEAWNKYIAWGCKPLQGFTLPKIIKRELFDECSYEAGIILDRTRMYKNLFGLQLDSSLKAEIKTWCDNKISECRKNEIY